VSAEASPARLRLRALLEPASLAVIGASRDPSKWGHRAISNTLAAGFAGPVYAVNPNAAGTLGGAAVIGSLTEAPQPIDCALLAVPAAAVEAAIADCVAAGVGAAVVIAAGLGEASDEGKAVERRLAQLASSRGLRLLGPNCFGLYRSPVGLVLTPHGDMPPGPLAVVAQSGNVTLALADMARRAGTGFSAAVGLGNQLDVGFGELLCYFAEDPATSAVGCYIEGVPPGAGSELISGLEACADANKPVVVIKAGRSQTGASVAATHTAALAADDRLWDRVLEDHHAVRVDSTEALLDTLLAATRVRRTRGRVAVVTDGGGDSVMAVDALERRGIELAELAPQTLAALGTLAPPAAPRAPGMNPLTIDGPGGMDDDPRLLARCAEVLATDHGVDVVVLGGVFGGYQAHGDEEMEAATQITSLFRQGKSLLMQSAYSAAPDGAIAVLRRAGIPIYPSFQRLADALAPLVDKTDASEETPYGGTATGAPGHTTLGETLLTPLDVAELISQVGVQAPALRLVSSPDELTGALAAVGLPACVKVIDPSISHKSEVGGVRAGLAGEPDVAAAAADLWARFPERPLLVMPSFPPGVELLVGAFHDEVFGAVAIVGRGGIWAEVEKDTVLIVEPRSPNDVLAHLPALRMQPILVGARGSLPLDLEALGKLTCALSELVRHDKRLTIEINPVIAYPAGLALADLRATRR
jgi:acyl-CoA synthetase (NDP forming)